MDGGLVANIPVTVARSMGADLVIAVDVNAEGAKFLGPSLSLIGVVIQSMLVVQRTASLAQLEAADLGHATGMDKMTIPQDRDPVADPEDLLEPV